MFVGFYVSYAQTSNKITYRVMFGVRFPTDQSMANIPICEVSKSKHTQSCCPICQSIYCPIGQSI